MASAFGASAEGSADGQTSKQPPNQPTNQPTKQAKQSKAKQSKASKAKQSKQPTKTKRGNETNSQHTTHTTHTHTQRNTIQVKPINQPAQYKQVTLKDPAERQTAGSLIFGEGKAGLKTNSLPLWIGHCFGSHSDHPV